jgi:hypothetical protein
VTIELSQEQAHLVLTSLEYTKSAFEGTQYPTLAMKRQRIKDVVEVIDAVRDARKKDRKEKT